MSVHLGWIQRYFLSKIFSGKAIHEPHFNNKVMTCFTGLHFPNLKVFFNVFIPKIIIVLIKEILSIPFITICFHSATLKANSRNKMESTAGMLGSIVNYAITNLIQIIKYINKSLKKAMSIYTPLEEETILTLEETDKC